MENDGNVVMVLFLFIMGVGLYLFVTSLMSSKKEKNQETKLKQIDFVRGKQALEFLDNFIYQKFLFYFNKELLPLYADKKVPEKKIVQAVRNNIFISVIGCLSPTVKKNYLDFLTEKGLEIYINEKIYVYMNNADLSFSGGKDSLVENMRSQDLQKILE